MFLLASEKVGMLENENKVNQVIAMAE